MNRIVRRALLALALLGYGATAVAQSATDDLPNPREFTYDAQGVTQVDLIAVRTKVMVGNTPYTSMVFNDNYDAPLIRTRPGGTIRLSLDNRTKGRALPALYVAGDELHHLLGHRKRFLTARTLLTNQTFRNLFRADMLEIDQRLKITSLTFVFTDCNHGRVWFVNDVSPTWDVGSMELTRLTQPAGFACP